MNKVKSTTVIEELQGEELEHVSGGTYIFAFDPTPDGQYVRITKTAADGSSIAHLTIRAGDLPRYKAKYGLA